MTYIIGQELMVINGTGESCDVREIVYKCVCCVCASVCVCALCVYCSLTKECPPSKERSSPTFPNFMFSPSFESPVFYCKFYLSVLLVYYFLFLITSELTVSAKGSVLMYLVSWWSILCCWILAFSI